MRAYFYIADSSLIATLTLKISGLQNENSLRKVEKCFIHLYSSETKNWCFPAKFRFFSDFNNEKHG